MFQKGPNALRRDCSTGISRRQGAHHGAQKLITWTRPSKDLRATGVPSSAGSSNSMAGAPIDSAPGGGLSPNQVCPAHSPPAPAASAASTMAAWVRRLKAGPPRRVHRPPCPGSAAPAARAGYRRSSGRPRRAARRRP